MALSNYRDISPPSGDVGAGFQFEFFCESCGDTWKTPFKPYRAGQANGVFRRFGYLFNEFAKISVPVPSLIKAAAPVSLPAPLKVYCLVELFTVALIGVSVVVRFTVVDPVAASSKITRSVPPGPCR